MTAAAPTIQAGNGRAPWRAQIAKYAVPRTGRSWLDIFTSVVPYLGLFVAMYLLLDVSVLLTLALAPLTAGFMLRTFIVFHDCTHGSFWHTKRANRRTGSVLGVLVFLPYASWAHAHAVHHATAGDLDRRGTGDVPMLTSTEYLSRSRGGRLLYRLYRHPFVMFGLGPLLSFVVLPRLVPKGTRPRLKRAIIATNVVLAALITTLCLTMGWWQYVIVQWPAAWMAASAGIFLFYVQHQFEDAYWERSDEWDFADAAIRGSSYFELPKVLQFFSGNIGYHHVHHLSAMVPNYNLQAAHENIALFRDVPVLNIVQAMRATRLKLWDDRSGRMVSFREAHAAAGAA